MPSAATCPSCQQTISSRLPSMDLGTPGDDEVTFIRQETRRLDLLIEQLNQERATLLRRLNTIQSPTKALPIEALSRIFEYACPPPDLSKHYASPSYTEDSTVELPEYQYFQFTLAAVSSHWRQGIWSNPHLWTWITLHITEANVEQAATFLRLFIKNSKNLPFTLALHFSRDANPRPHLVHQTVDDLLIEALPRITELHLVNPPSQWYTYTRHLSQIGDYSLSFNPSEHPTPVGQVILPLENPLRRLSLQGMHWHSGVDIQVPWTTITSLNLSSIAPDLSVQVFLQCQNLIEFRCRSLSNSWHQPPPEPVTLSHPVSFPYLEDFRWETCDSPWSRALIRYLHVPALKEMRWNTFNDRHSDNNDIRAFFNRLPPTLTTVALDSTTSHLEYIRDDSSIEVLVLCRCTTRDLRTLFRKLRPNLQGGHTTKPLPRLCGVLIGHAIRDADTMEEVRSLDGSYSTALVEILEKRLDESNDKFVLMTAKTGFLWGIEVFTRMVRLTNKGYTAEVVEDFNLKDDFWL